MAVIDSIRMLFTADVSGLETGAKKAKGILNDLNKQAGRQSSLGLFAQALRGAGIVGGVGLLATIFENLTGKIRTAAFEMAVFNKSLREVTGDAARSIPIFGSMVRGWDNVLAVFKTGKLAEEYRALEGAETAINIFDKLDAMRRNRVSGEKMLGLEGIELTVAKISEEGKEAVRVLNDIYRKALAGGAGSDVLSMIQNEIAAQEKLVGARTKLAVSEDVFSKAEERQKALDKETESLRVWAETVKDAIDPAREIAREMDRLNEAVAAGFLTADEASEASPIAKMMKEAEDALRKIREDEAARAMDEQAAYYERMERLAEQIRFAVSPFERFKSDIEELSEVFESGMITIDEYLARLAQLEDEYIGLSDIAGSAGGAGVPAAPPTVLAGTQQAFSVLNARTREGAAEELLKKIKENSEKELGELRKIRSAVENTKDLVVSLN